MILLVSSFTRLYVHSQPCFFALVSAHSTYAMPLSFFSTHDFLSTGLEYFPCFGFLKWKTSAKGFMRGTGHHMLVHKCRL